MPRGPLPDPNRLRRNADTVPTTRLSAAGRKGSAPKPPGTLELGKHGKAWWTWAWKLPEACAWSTGQLYIAERRASLEDLLAAIDGPVQSVELPDAVNGSDVHEDVRRLVDALLAQIKRVSASRVNVMKEMRELDVQLGLTPKARQAHRWEIVDDKPRSPEPAPRARKTATASPSRRGLRLVAEGA